ncbi:MAG TPA: hypothetical protein VFV19_18685 [Candidatus Polarisedimenticolaceae bacterium]|nr:hypothetical protein [Candidatus Polarisedimenticolaceae bacterium]
MSLMRSSLILGIFLTAASTASAQVCSTPPSEARNLTVSGSNPTHLSWQPPADAGGSTTILYDVLGSSTPGDFSAAQCLASGTSATTYDESGFTGIRYYLVRSRNACGSSLGSGSNGNPRTGAACPQSDGGQCFNNFDCVTTSCCSGFCRNLATNTDNCGNCGNVCSTVNGTPSCGGGTCTIACNTGFMNCDGSATNGCECGGNLCCSGACEPAHFNGLGQSFDDCAPLGTPGTGSTYTHTLAVEARAAWPFPAVIDDDCICGTGTTTTCVYRQTATSCAVWEFKNATGLSSPAGHVNLNTANNGCVCPSGTDATWR